MAGISGGGCWRAEISDELAGINGRADGEKTGPGDERGACGMRTVSRSVVLNVRDGFADRAFIQGGLLVNQAGHEGGMAELVDAAW